MDIKTEIRSRRESLGKSPHKLSTELGLSKDYIGKVEAGKWDPSLATLRKMAVYFRLHGEPFSEDLEALLGYSFTRKKVAK